MTAKMFQYDYDFILARDADDVEPICLTDAERQIILTMLDYVGWETRWHSVVGTPISTEKILAWRDSIANKLIFGNCEMNCLEVWQCLGIDDPPEDLLEWLLDQLQNNGDVIDIINSGGGIGESPVVSELMYTNCNSDYLYGFIVQLVKFINLAITNAYEKFEVLTNTLEFYQAVAESIPIMTQVTDFVTYLQETIVEEYLAEYDETYELEITCELFCLARQPGNECSLTWQQLYEYFLDRFGAGLENKDILDLLQYILGGGWEGTEFADASFAAFCGIMYYAGEWVGLTISKVQNWWESFTDDPDNDWEILCPACAWRIDYLYENADARGWSVIYGQWLAPPNANLYSEHVEGVHETSKVERTFSPSFDGLNEVWADGCKISYSNTHVGAGVYLHVVHGGGTYDDTYYGDPDGENVKFVLPTTLDGVSYITIEVREDTVGDGGSTRTSGITLIGAGDNPPPADE